MPEGSYLYCDVSLPVPLDQPFTYALPETLRHRVKAGCRVLVPFGSRKLTGVALRFSAVSPKAKAYAILNQSSGHCLVTVKGMLVNPAGVSGPVNFEGFGLTTNVMVLRPGMVTNVLCFTNGVLMDVK